MINLSLGIMIIWVCCSLGWVNGEDPYRYYTFQVTYGTRAPLGVAQKVLLSSSNLCFVTLISTSSVIYMCIYIFFFFKIINF